MLPVISMIYRFLTLIVVFSASASSQSADIVGWSDLRWGTTKAVALKTLQPFGAHDCNRSRSVSRAGLQSDYDGDDENTHTIWIWSKAHGKLSLDSEESDGVFTVSLVNSRNN